MNLFLPVVKPEIGGSLQQEMPDNDIKYVKDQLRRLDTENPTVAHFIRNFAKTTKDKVGSAYCGLIVYRLLESQAEANRMYQEELEAEQSVMK